MYKRQYVDSKGNDLRGKAEIIIAKHRNGAVGDVLLTFRGEYARFQNPDDDATVPMPGESGIGGEMIGGNAPMGADHFTTLPPDSMPFAPPAADAPF